MQELFRTNRLIMVVAAFVLVIIIGLVTFKRPDVSYTISANESLIILNDTINIITPDQIAAIQKSEAGKIVFIDVRNSIAFEKGHLKSAVNIPVRELFTTESRAAFHKIEKGGQLAILYGETQQQATGPWFVLRQTGYKNIKLFTGTYSQLDLSAADSITRLLPQLSEIPLIDTAALRLVSATAAKTDAQAGKSEQKSVVPVKKATSSGGGC